MAKQVNRRLISTGVSVLFCGLFAVDASAQSKPMVAEIIPPAKSGECYAKVNVPAQYRDEEVDVLLKEPTERFDLTPAKFENRSESVLIREASSTLKAIQPTLETEEDFFQVAAATTRWVRGSLNGKTPLSEGEKSDIAAAGIEIAEVEAGSCLYEHYVEPVIKQVPNRVLISEATEKLSTTPAKFNKAEEEVLVKAGYKRLVSVPAIYKKKQDRVLVEAAHSVWQKGTGPIQKIDNQTGEIMCRVDIPAEYKTLNVDVIATEAALTSVDEPAVYKTVSIETLEADAAEQRESIPAEFKTINVEKEESSGSYTWLATRAGAEGSSPTGRVVCHQDVPAKQIAYDRTVVKTAGRFERKEVAEVFETITIAELVEDAQSVKTAVPGVSSKITRRIKIEDSRFEWQPVLCETNTNGDIITRLQAALKSEGYNPGAVDGVLGRSTLTALEEYQRKNSLAEGGVTIESIKSLGVEL